jgi:hypothetical protein
MEGVGGLLEQRRANVPCARNFALTAPVASAVQVTSWWLYVPYKRWLGAGRPVAEPFAAGVGAYRWVLGL